MKKKTFDIIMLIISIICIIANLFMMWDMKRKSDLIEKLLYHNATQQ